jgi:hypothetical protein
MRKLNEDAMQLQQQLLAEALRVYEKAESVPVIQKGSNEWIAWRNFRTENGLPVTFMDRCDRWTVPTVWPGHDRSRAKFKRAA